jgi:hypothetical protein
MSSSQSTTGSRRYRYYLCRQAQKWGWPSCPAPAVPAGPLEALVLAQLGAAAAEFACAAGDAAWAALPPGEQARAVQRWVAQIDFDGVRGLVTIRLRIAESAVQAELALALFPVETDRFVAEQTGIDQPGHNF